MIASNINSFYKHVLKKSFNIRKTQICEQVLICKEDREQLTKSQIAVLSRIFSLLNLIQETIQLKDGEPQLEAWIQECLKDLIYGLHEIAKPHQQQFCIEVGIYIVLIPQVFKLQLLVEDRELENSLRRHAIKYLKSISQENSNQGIFSNIINSNSILSVPILDPSSVDPAKTHIYSPRLMMNLCLGFLKLCELDDSLKRALTFKIHLSIAKNENSFKAVVEQWLNCDSPFENESGKVLVKFMSKLGIPNNVLLEWITLKTAAQVYHKCSDILLSYIADNWTKPCIILGAEASSLQDDEDQIMDDKHNEEEKYSCLGEFLIAKIQNHQAQLYSLFIPIAEKLTEHADASLNMKILVEFIPTYCTKEIKHEFKDVAINQIKLLGLIAVKARMIISDTTSKIGQVFVDFLVQRIASYLKEKFSVYVKKEVLNLFSLVADFPISSKQRIYDSLEPSLNYVKKMHFPMKSRELKAHSNEAQNFLVIVEAFLSMAIITKNLKVLRLLYQVIREHKTSFEQTLKHSINIIVTQQINQLPMVQFLEVVSEFITEFKNRHFDKNVVDNVRWAIARKIIIRILETCSQDKLVEIMIKWNQEFILVLKGTEFSSYADQPLDFYLLVREKTFIMIFYEILYRRIPGNIIKETLHKRLYGAECQQNELSKMLIEIAAHAKKEKIQSFEFICAKVGQDEFPADYKADHNSVQQVQNFFCCAAYSMLCSVIVCTQTNEVVFANFLFNPRQGKATESLWSLIIDTSQEFEFKVHTNFNHIELKSIEQKLAESEQNVPDIAGARVQRMMNEYITTSFMGANEGFNQDMVFETQLDKLQIKKEEQKLQEIFDQKYNPHTKSTALGSLATSSIPSQNSNNLASQSQDIVEELAGTFIPDEESQFELDSVNSHWCMKNIKRCIERMKLLFGEEWKNNGDQLPQFARYLLNEFSQPETHINVKIFILKIITNNPKLFKPYAKLWFEPICEYLTSKDKRGKGFHYFLRDLCTMLISWDYIPEESPRHKLLLTEVINSLVLISADKIKLIFKQNIQIVSTLMRKWKHLIAINKLVLAKMIAIPDSETDSHLWKMNAIEVLALAVCYDIPVLLKPQEIEYLHPKDRKFRLEAGNKIDPLMMALLKTFDSKKKQLIYAASELVGMILNSQQNEACFQEILKHCKTAIFSNEVRERHDVFVHSIEGASREYSELLTDRQIFLKTMSFIDILTGSMRAAVFNTYERYVKVAKLNNNISAINEICMSLLAVSKEILADINDENQQAFTTLLITLQELKGVDSVEKLLAAVVPQLKQLFVQNKSEYSRGRFYDLMVNLYDRYEIYRSHPAVQSALVHGLNDSSKMIRDKVAEFWNDQNRLELDPMQRLQQLMEVLYVNDEENIWLTNAVYLLLQVSCRSSDYNRKIFEEPLQECQFAPLHLDMMDNGGILNRSQPMTPLFTQVDQMLQASQNAQENQAEGTGQDHLSIAAVQSRGNGNDNRSPHRVDTSRMEQGFVRATQLPQFTQTQAMPSALIAGYRNNNVQATLSDTFYGVKNQGKSPTRTNPPKNNKPVHQGGVKGGTQLFTISEEAGEEANDNAATHSQDSEGFIAPAPVRRKPNQKFSEFFKKINFAYRPMEVTGGQKIRFVHEATMPSHLARQEEIRRMQRSQFIDRQIQQRKNRVNLYRQYRIGELPDIQIDFKDVLMPLMAIARADSTIATEVFVEIFKELYSQEKDKDVRQKLGEGLRNILSTSKLYDYSVINCAHRIAIELLKIDGFTIDSAVIERTGEHSMSFQTSLILLEESLIRGDMKRAVEDNEKANKRKQEGSVIKAIPFLDSNNRQLHQITSMNRSYWFKLIKLYEIIGNQDALHGIWCQLAQQDGIVYKRSIASQSQNNSPNNLEQFQQQQERVVNLIKDSQDLRNKGRIEEALRELENTLSSPELSADFEPSVKKELENKKFEYKAELLKWDQIANELLQANKNKQLYDIAGTSGFKQVDIMIRSQIRTEQYWESLTGQINLWLRDDYSKAMLEKNFSYELAMLFLTQLDYDRARIYIEREASELLAQWKNLTKLSQVAQHFLVQRIQKIYEMKEFLELVKNDFDTSTSGDALMEHIIQSMLNWKERNPSESFDPLSVWDDIAQARLFFIDQYAVKFQNTPLQKTLLGGSQSEEGPLASKLSALSDIQVMLHIQTAKGAFKMGAFDSSDRYLKLAQNKRKKAGGSNDMRIIVPIIKLKAAQSKGELRNLSFDQKKAKTEKIYRIFLNKMEQNVHDLSQVPEVLNIKQGDHLSANPELASIKTVVKSNLLKFSLQKKLLSIVLDEAASDKNLKELGRYSPNINYYLDKCFGSLTETQKYLENGCVIGQQVRGQFSSTEQQVYATHQQGKLLFKLAKFSDKLLRKMEQRQSSNCILITQGLQTIDRSEASLAKLTISSGLNALNMGYLQASDIIPRLLDVLGKYRDSVKDEFIEQSKSTPAWLYLRWISQIAAILNRPESTVIQTLVGKIASKYPQALYYPFKVIESNLEAGSSTSNQQVSQLFSSLKYKFSQFEMLNQWTEALDCLIFPEHRFKYWFQLVCETYQDSSMQASLLKEAKGGQSGELLQKIRRIVLLMYADIMTESKPMVGQNIGLYNLQFIQKWEPVFSKSFGKNGDKVLHLDLTSLVTELQNINKKISQVQLFHGNELVSKYSEWLDKLDCNEFYQVKNYIEIPGQYEKQLFLQEPQSQKNVKIASIKKTCVVLGSIRRPKKITVHGSNEKDYHLLVKGGEDLRLDQRVQQLFTIMNRIFQEDPACENRDLNIKTFGVVPMTNRLGTLEWVDSTEPMKALISKEHKRLEDGRDLHESRAYSQRMNWLRKLPGNKGVTVPAQLHLTLLNHEDTDVIKAFEEHQNAFPCFLLRNALENLCLTSSAFLTIKNQFLKSIAVFSVASYLIGIGDRHLENFLIDTTDGEVLGIDFGIAFGSGVTLSIPELVPFRLTQQIEGVIAPHPLGGIFKQTMVHALAAMRKKKSLILDACEIFVKEPLIDWVKDAKQRNNGQKVASGSNQASGMSSIRQEEENLSGFGAGSMLTMEQRDESELSWYPRKKIEVVKKKLLGINPVKVLYRELKESVHCKKDYSVTLQKAIQGPDDGLRYFHLSEGKKYMEVEDQVDILIELARDPNILGRTWIGWSPYI